jgi:hypothetical protein
MYVLLVGTILLGLYRSRDPNSVPAPPVPAGRAHSPVIVAAD